MKIPDPRGPLSHAIASILTRPFGSQRGASDAVAFDRAARAITDPLGDDDLHLALAVCYELHYRGFDGVDDRFEWDAAVLARRAVLERRFEEALRSDVVVHAHPADSIDVALTKLIDADTGPALSSYLMKLATLEQFKDFVRRRSVYHLKEADPHSWAIPRVVGRTKAALVEIQADEYGGGRADAMHSALFGATMRALDLDDIYGAYWPDADGATFAVTNLMSMFGLHRRLRGAALGHLAMFEMTSTAPNRRYGNGLRRLGFGSDATRFYDVHVEADAVHEQIAAVDMCGSFVAAEPAQRAAVLFGAACGLELDARASASLLRSWDFGVDRSVGLHSA